MSAKQLCVLQLNLQLCPLSHKHEAEAHWRSISQDIRYLIILQIIWRSPDRKLG